MAPTPATNTPQSVLKSPLDPNEYKFVELRNGLRALLISTLKPAGFSNQNRKMNPATGVWVEVEEFNRSIVRMPTECRNDGEVEARNPIVPDTVEETEPKEKRPKTNDDDDTEEEVDGSAFMSLTVGAGSISDPSDLLGMAHLCEHIVIDSSSKKYSPQSFFAHVRKNGGYCNAGTGEDTTSYFCRMDLNATGVEPFKVAVDMLGDAMGNLDLPKERVQKEDQILDLEFSYIQGNEGYRFWSLMCLTTDDSHPFGKFGFGNCETLGKPDLCERLVEWKQRHYASNYMTLAIKAPLDLESLEAMLHSFDQIPSNPKPESNVEIAQKFGNPFDSPKFNRYYKYAPVVADIQVVWFSWALPSQFFSSSTTKPLLYLEQFFNPDSYFLEFLKEKRWANTILVEDLNFAMGLYSFFSLQIFLTDAGFGEIQNVTKAMFSYLSWIKNLDPKTHERRFSELRRELLDSFHYSGPKSDPWGDSFNEISERMQNVKDPRYILTSGSLVTGFDLELIQDCISRLTPTNMNIILCSKNLEKETEGQLLVDKWFGTNYRVQDFSPEFLKEWSCVESFQILCLPNPCRVKNVSCPVQCHGVTPSPQEEVIVFENEKVLVSYEKTNHCPWREGSIPIGSAVLTLSSPLIDTNTWTNSLLAIWVGMLEDHLEKMLFQHSRTLVESGIFSSGSNIVFHASGLPFKLTKLIANVLATIMRFEELVDEQRFLDTRASLIQYLNTLKANPNATAYVLQRFILLGKFWTCHEMLAIVKGLDFQDFKNMLRRFKDRMFVVVHFEGCVSNGDLISFSNVVEKISNGFRELPENFPDRGNSTALQHPLGERCLRIKSPSLELNSSVVLNHYQFGSNVQRNQFAILALILQNNLNWQLREMERLAYIVFVSATNYKGIPGLMIWLVVQPHRHTTGYIDERIDNSLVDFRQSLVKINEEDPLTLVNFTPQIFQQILQMYDEYLLPNGKGFRKLSTQVVGWQSPSKPGIPLEPLTIEDKIRRVPITPTSGDSAARFGIEVDVPAGLKQGNGYFITDLAAFKKSLFAYPLQP